MYNKISLCSVGCISSVTDVLPAVGETISWLSTFYIWEYNPFSAYLALNCSSLLIPNFTASTQLSSNWSEFVRVIFFEDNYLITDIYPHLFASLNVVWYILKMYLYSAAVIDRAICYVRIIRICIVFQYLGLLVFPWGDRLFSAFFFIWRWSFKIFGK